MHDIYNNHVNSILVMITITKELQINHGNLVPFIVIIIMVYWFEIPQKYKSRL